MHNIIGIKCVRCGDPVVTLTLLGDDIVVTVDCAICSTESSTMLEDFLSGEDVPMCCDLQLFPNFWCGSDLLLALICDRCITQNPISLDDAVEKLFDLAVTSSPQQSLIN